MKSWLRAAVGTSVTIHIVNQTGTIAFLDGVMIEPEPGSDGTPPADA